MSSTLADIIMGGTDLSWTDRIACGEAGMSANDFFVQAGHTINPEVIEVCRGCPVRRECLLHTYRSSPAMLGSGYFAGLSPGQRKKMTEEEALEFIEADTKAWEQEQTAVAAPRRRRSS